MLLFAVRCAPRVALRRMLSAVVCCWLLVAVVCGCLLSFGV